MKTLLKFSFILCVLFFIGCEKEESYHTLQYQVFANPANKAVYSLEYVNANNASVFTGEIDTTNWFSPVYSNAKAGSPIRFELKHDGASTSIDMFILKDGSVVAKKELRSPLDESILSISL